MCVTLSLSVFCLFLFVVVVVVFLSFQMDVGNWKPSSFSKVGSKTSFLFSFFLS